MKKYCLLIPLVILMIAVFAQDGGYIVKEIVIVKSTKDYEAVKQFTDMAAQKTGYKKDLRRLVPNGNNGLSLPADECEKAGTQAPCYWARGGFDDGTYVSIEYSNAYKGFTKGYYIVVISSAKPGAAQTKKALNKAKTFAPDAYLRKSKVYIGCMH